MTSFGTFVYIHQRSVPILFATAFAFAWLNMFSNRASMKTWLSMADYIHYFDIANEKD